MVKVTMVTSLIKPFPDDNMFAVIFIIALGWIKLFTFRNDSLDFVLGQVKHQIILWEIDKRFLCLILIWDFNSFAVIYLLFSLV